MTDKIEPEAIADETGLSVDDVNAVLAHLVPNWLFARYVDNDLVATDYHDIREGRR
jgi:hypothetical protein